MVPGGICETPRGSGAVNRQMYPCDSLQSVSTQRPPLAGSRMAHFCEPGALLPRRRELVRAEPHGIRDQVRDAVLLGQQIDSQQRETLGAACLLRLGLGESSSRGAARSRIREGIGAA